MAAAPEDAWPPNKERQQNKENRATSGCLTLFLTVDYWYVGTKITLVPLLQRKDDAKGRRTPFRTLNVSLVTP